ncbi:proton-coupled amino acid transporter-like protein pathetic [Bombus fervidus]|uniref:proton-coupled amino acid transporter-like protein pathetic n=1 Tax=Bombus fervidus TaxID=203811 RepID=UPI003AB58F2E
MKNVFTDFATFMHLCKGSIGNGVLFLPNGFRRAGYATSVICSVVIGLLCTHTVVVLVRCSQVLCRRNRIPMLDFAKTAEVSFQTGPKEIRKYGKTFGIVTNVIVCFVHFQAAVIYILYVSTSFQQLIEFFFDVKMDDRIYILALFPFVCLLSFIPNLKYLTPFSVVGALFMLIGISVTLYYLFEDFPDPARLEAFTQVFPVPMYCSLFLYALHNVTLCLPLENSMKNPEHLPRLITCNMLLNTCLYTMFGFLGYNKYMKNTCDTVIKNLPLEKTLAKSIKITVSLSVLFSFGMVFYVPISILWPMIRSKFNKMFRYGEAVFRFCSVIATTILAVSIPEMVPLLSLFAALSMTTIMLLMPAVIETATKWEQSTRFLLVKNIGITLIWILLLIFGTIESILSIIKEYGGVKEEGC